MLKVVKGIYQNGVIKLESNSDFKEGDKVLISKKKDVSRGKKEKKTWGFMETNEYIKKKYGILQVSDALIQERESSI